MNAVRQCVTYFLSTRQRPHLSGSEKSLRDNSQPRLTGSELCLLQGRIHLFWVPSWQIAWKPYSDEWSCCLASCSSPKMNILCAQHERQGQRVFTSGTLKEIDRMLGVVMIFSCGINRPTQSISLSLHIPDPSFRPLLDMSFYSSGG